MAGIRSRERSVAGTRSSELPSPRMAFERYVTYAFAPPVQQFQRLSRAEIGCTELKVAILFAKAVLLFLARSFAAPRRSNPIAPQIGRDVRSQLRSSNRFPS
jgi:hypothetical protein